MMPVARRLTRVLWLPLILGVASCNSEPQNAVEHSLEDGSGGRTVEVEMTTGHQRMIEILAEIKRKAPQEHFYHGQGSQVQMRQIYEKHSGRLSVEEDLKALCKLGEHELLYDPEPSQAIEHLTAAYALIPEARFPSPREHAVWSGRTKFFLGVANLRLGETENCCLRHNAESCILPIRGGGIHTQPRGSREAIKYFLEVLADTRGTKEISQMMRWHAPAKWLLNIAYMTLGEYPEQVPDQYRIPTAYFESDIEFPKFKNVAPMLNLPTFNAAGGAVVDDFDNDHYLDIFTSTSDPTLPALYFRNNRDGTFTDMSEAAGLRGLYGGLNLVQADYNNDGYLDIYIVRGAWLQELGRHPNSLLRNNGNGTFTDVTFEAGLGIKHFPCKTAAWADYDNDGHVDLFVGNEAVQQQWSDKHHQVLDAPSQLFRNNGDGTFTDVAASAGVDVQAFVMGAVWGDFNQDRYPDLFLSSTPRHYLFENNRNGTFTDVTKRAGILRPQISFPTWFWDFDNDGALDLFVASTSETAVVSAQATTEDISFEQGVGSVATQWLQQTGGPWSATFELSAHFRGNGSGTFVNLASEHGLTSPSVPMGANFGDINGDGFLDFYLATGNIAYWDLMPNLMYVNQGGKGFANVTMNGGFGHLQKGHGTSFADIDNDGDQDLYVQTGGQLPGDKFNDALFENPGFGHNWISIKLVGKTSNRAAIGASIKVTTLTQNKPRSIHRHVSSGGSFGCNPLRQNIGLANADHIESIEIFWPTSGITQVFRDVPRDQMIQIIEGGDQYETVTRKPIKLK